MDDALKIYVDRLRTQGVEAIDETVAPDFLDVKENDLQFVDPVVIKGEAYLVQNELMLKLTVSTQARMPCGVCNEPVPVSIEVKDLVHMVDIDHLKRGYFDMRELLREDILLEVPLSAECNEGHCPKRKDMEKYLKKKEKMKTGGDEQGFKPFANLK